MENDTEVRIVVGNIEVRRVPGGWRLWRMKPDNGEWIGKSIYRHHQDALRAAKRLDVQEAAKGGLDW